MTRGYMLRNDLPRNDKGEGNINDLPKPIPPSPIRGRLKGLCPFKTCISPSPKEVDVVFA